MESLFKQPVELPGKHGVEVYGGGYLSLDDPEIDKIRLEDIAISLSRICRFNGHGKSYYSVAEHATHCARFLLQRGHRYGALLALHHDDGEAYLGDVTKPLKPLLGSEYADLTDGIDNAIAIALGGHWQGSDFHAEPLVKQVDNFMLAYEADKLLPSKGLGWAPETLWPISDYQAEPFCVSPEAAKEMWLQMHATLIT